jgi:hypothetical protein
MGELQCYAAKYSSNEIFQTFNTFKFINAADLPQDWPQETWEADMTNPDGVGGESNEFPKEKV